MAVTAIVACLSIPAAAGAASARPVEELEVRIAILKDAVEVRLASQGDYELLDPGTGKLLDSGRRLPETVIRPLAEGIWFDGKVFPVKKLRLSSRKPITVFVQGKERTYRGQLAVVLTPQQKLVLVNTLGLEDYIRGVLYHEVSHRWPLEAIKAQAVATRTYAIYQIGQNRKAEYDVTSDIYSQVYGGRNSERYRTNMAAERTKGEVLTFSGQVLPAYFHAACGGHTEAVQELWKHDLFPLKGVVCRFCDHAPHARWKKNFQLKMIQDKLNEKGYGLDLIKEIRILDRNASGRIGRLLITTRGGKSVEIPGKDFRLIIGPNEIRSNNYRVEMKGYYADFIGRGWGHGVGMCQWGAMGMAQQRYDYQEILTYYYPGAKIEKIVSLPAATVRP